MIKACVILAGSSALALALIRKTKATKSAKGNKPSPEEQLVFRSGGIELEPQDLPAHLHPYHSKSLELTERAFRDPLLNCERGISYGTEPHQLLDVWTDAASTTTSAKSNGNTDGKRPVVVFLHGGGWDWGYREWVGFCARTICCKEGAVMIAPSYKVGKGREQMYPQSRDDIVAALQWISKHAGEYGGDAQKIILAGHSAGGHLAACTLAESHLESTGFDTQTIKALFIISSPLGVRCDDLLMMIQNRWLRILLRRPATFLFNQFIKRLTFLKPIMGHGKDSGELRSFLQNASPLGLVSNDKTGAFPKQIHVTYASEKDFPFCREHAEELGKKLGQSVDTLEMNVNGHFETHFALDDASNEWFNSFRRVISHI